MRVITGFLKRKTIKAIPQMRPASFRVKKGIVDILKDVFPDSRVLDLFAGSGALGIEAISAGAKEVFFVDINRNAVKILLENLAACKVLSQSTVLHKDAYKAVKDFYERNKMFDFIFIDPPYHTQQCKKALQTLELYDIVAASGYIIMLFSRNDEFIYPTKHFSLISKKTYGQSVLLVLEKR